MNDFERLGQLVKAERVRRYRTVDRARNAAGVSRGAWDNVEHGRPAKPLTYNSIELALGWELGDCERILAGGEPTRGAEVDDNALAVQRSNLPDPVKRRVLELLREESGSRSEHEAG